MDEKNEDSTTKIYRVLKSGPLSKPSVLVSEKIYDNGDVININEDEKPNGNVIVTLNHNSPKLTNKKETLDNKPQELSDEEIIKIMKERFSGKAENYSGPMKSIPEHSILNAPVMDDKEGNCVVQAGYS